jgi:hypothetical protein
MLFHAYLRNGNVYVPTVVRLQIGEAYWDVEPVAVEPIANTEGSRRAFFDAIARKNAFVPNPPKNKWPRPILLKYSGAKTWSVFARNASLWSIDEENGVYSITGYKEHPDGYLVRDKSRKTDFPPGTPADAVIDRMIAILQDAARSDRPSNRMSRRRPATTIRKSGKTRRLVLTLQTSSAWYNLVARSRC